jgi:hypothetical protein
MRIFKTGGVDNETVNLDDVQIYSHLPSHYETLRNLMFQEIGYSYCYMNYWNNDIYSVYDSQKEKINELIRYFTDNEKDNRGNILWFREQVFIFQCEIENMC